MELPDDIQELNNLVARLLERISQLETENAELRRRLGLKSHNSSKPPSSDGLAKKPGLPKAGGKKNGGQLGHRGKTLESVAQPDEIVVHDASECRRCLRKFSESEVEQIVAKRQVFDIPEPRIRSDRTPVGRN